MHHILMILLAIGLSWLALAILVSIGLCTLIVRAKAYDATRAANPPIRSMRPAQLNRHL